jgi:hypothetical protein
MPPGVGRRARDGWRSLRSLAPLAVVALRPLAPCFGLSAGRSWGSTWQCSAGWSWGSTWPCSAGPCSAGRSWTWDLVARARAAKAWTTVDRARRTRAMEAVMFTVPAMRIVSRVGSRGAPHQGARDGCGGNEGTRSPTGSRVRRRPGPARPRPPPPPSSRPRRPSFRGIVPHRQYRPSAGLPALTLETRDGGPGHLHRGTATEAATAAPLPRSDAHEARPRRRTRLDHG